MSELETNNVCNLIILIRTVLQVMCVHGTKQLKLTIICMIWGFYSSSVEDLGLLWCDALSLSYGFLMFGRT